MQFGNVLFYVDSAATIRSGEETMEINGQEGNFEIE